jgi:uncharacterized protein
MIARLTFSHVFCRHGIIAAALLAFAFVGSARPAAAQQAQPSPAAILLAKQIMDLKHVKELYNPLIRGVVIKARDTFMQTNFMWAKDLSDIANQLQQKYAPRVDELVDIAARAYASHFTEAELKQLLAFYQSPLGQKVIEEEPKALNDSMNAADQWANNLSLEVIDSMRAEMKKRGHDI